MGESRGPFPWALLALYSIPVLLIVAIVVIASL
jgi:hypothetical protein